MLNVQFAVQRGFLNPRSPLLRSNLAGNKGIDIFNWASDDGLLLQVKSCEQNVHNSH